MNLIIKISSWVKLGFNPLSWALPWGIQAVTTPDGKSNLVIFFLCFYLWIGEGGITGYEDDDNE